ncbi:unnamed protein product [Absidia cylindrospora]
MKIGKFKYHGGYFVMTQRHKDAHADGVLICIGNECVNKNRSVGLRHAGLHQHVIVIPASQIVNMVGELYDFTHDNISHLISPKELSWEHSLIPDGEIQSRFS